MNEAATTNNATVTATAIAEAARLIKDADSLLITAGAGMGVDSGLADFRGNEGFWLAYPALASSGIDFTSIANPHSFVKNPKQAWGFYGHRLALYRQTIPHEGFGILQAFAKSKPHGAFVVTSNVDGQFQKAGFPSNLIYEIHGSIHYLQCSKPCCQRHWPADEVEPLTDEERCEWIGNELLTCPYCGAIARPAILMFNDVNWAEGETPVQRDNWEAWMRQVQRPVTIELGAGIQIPSIRRVGEIQDHPLIRINPMHFQLGYEGTGVSIPMGAKAALTAIAKALALE